VIVVQVGFEPLPAQSPLAFDAGQPRLIPQNNYSGTLIGYSDHIMTDEDVTTIQLKKSVVKELKNIRKYPRETYNETISNLIKAAKESKKKRQYDEFLHEVQQSKMKELWDNAEDEAWEHA
jgi:hypothetical protein